ncbi:hypothetical protein JA1_005438, partial [Spathaspora sp. JA1]
MKFILAVIISEPSMVVAPPYTYSKVEERIITPTGSLTFRGFDSVQASGKFTNAGTFLATNEGSTKSVVFNLCDHNSPFSNEGRLTFYDRTTQWNLWMIDSSEFKNTGEILMDSDFYQTTLRIISAGRWNNQGKITFQNKASREAMCYLSTPSPIENSGIIEFNNAKYLYQSNGLLGDGCIKLEHSSTMEIESVTIIENRIFMGEGATLTLKIVPNYPPITYVTYTLVNFSEGNRLKIMERLNSLEYLEEDGRLVITTKRIIFYLMIGRGYDPNSFRFDLNLLNISPHSLSEVTYSGKAPQDPFRDTPCGVFPLVEEVKQNTNVAEQVHKSTTFTSTIERPDITFTAIIAISTNDDAIWQTQTHILKLAQYSTTYTDSTGITKTGEVIVSTDGEGHWYTSTIDLALTKFTTTYIDEFDTKTAEVIISTDPKGHWYRSSSQLAFTIYTTTYSNDIGNMNTGEVIISTDAEGQWYTSTSQLAFTKFTATYTDGTGNTKSGEVIISTDPYGQWYTSR